MALDWLLASAAGDDGGNAARLAASRVSLLLPRACRACRQKWSKAAPGEHDAARLSLKDYLDQACSLRSIHWPCALILA